MRQCGARQEKSGPTPHSIRGRGQGRTQKHTELRRARRLGQLAQIVRNKADCVLIDDGLPEGWRERVAHWAAEKGRIRELYLFGSRAKGNFTDRSDVDLAYILTGSDPGEVLAYSIYERAGWEAELQIGFGARAQLHMADPLTDAIAWPAVSEHGQLIYRKPGC